jgi:uncharacterized protein YceK
MTRTWIACVLGLALPWGSGCGTIGNLASGRPEPYGGVAKDIEFLETPTTTPQTGQGGPIFAAVWLADLCVSATLDTLTLPLVIHRDVRLQRLNPGPAEGDAAPERKQFSVGAVAEPSPD